MTKRSTSLRFDEGTKRVGTATVHQEEKPQNWPAKKLAEKFGPTNYIPGFDDIADSIGAPVLLHARAATETPRAAAKKALQALGRLKSGAMNQTEKRYAAHLAARQHAGEIVWFRFEGMKFRLADKTFYTPDFAVMLSSGELECHEVKGFWEDDARVKVKVVADQYPLRFIAVTAQTKKAGGGWLVEEF